MHVRRLVKQLFFQNTSQHRLDSLIRAAARQFGHLNSMPREHFRWQHQHRLVSSRQQSRRRLAVAGENASIRHHSVGELVAGAVSREGGNNELAHGLINSSPLS